jgi:hypothetical protein
MSKVASILLILIPFQVFCQSSDIWLLKIDSKNGKILFSDPKNITGKLDYENQPSFSKNGAVVYYTAQKDTSSPSEIYSYTISTGNTKQLISLVTSPYSPRPVPSGNGISVLMVEEDSSQRIWHYSFTGENPYPIFNQRDSIGYYDWIDAHSVLAFILSGKNNPDRLTLIKTDGTEKMIAENVGRGIKVIDEGAFFIQRKDTINYLAWTDYKTSKKLLKTPGGSVDLTIYKNHVLMARGGTIYGARILKKRHNDVMLEAFKPLQELGTLGLQNITRMAVSPDGQIIAIVTNR